MIYYFAYGGNCNKIHITKHYPNIQFVDVGILSDYKVIFRDTEPFKQVNSSLNNIESAYCDIIKCKDNVVYGILYKIDDDSKRRFDIQEKVPDLYVIKEVKITLKSEEIKAFTYVMREDIECKIGIPTERYYNIVKNGYQIYNINNELFTTN
jgi:gamma-glutamylcyclotransferase (GGCT)/AIG2-like uncharacterized protein YtfP